MRPDDTQVPLPADQLRPGAALSFLCAVALAGCSSADDSRGFAGSGVGTSAQGTAGDEAGADADGTGVPGDEMDSTGDGDGDGDGDTKFDVGVDDQGGDEGGDELDDACEKVDFLFVIDNSGSMAANQANLVASFPGFIAGIESTLGSVNDVHVGVITTDDYRFNPEDCREYGALVTSTGGDESSDSICGPYAEGGNYMTLADDLDASFACAAKVGVLGRGYERPMYTMLESMSPELTGAEGCNEGFYRDDARLVIVIITDEADGPGDPEEAFGPDINGNPSISEGTPASWFEDVVAFKAGVETNIVVLGLTNYVGGNCEPADVPDVVDASFVDGANIKAFSEMFTYGFVGGICEEDYGPVFGEAVGVINNACDTFQPPG